MFKHYEELALKMCKNQYETIYKRKKKGQNIMMKQLMKMKLI